MAIKSLLSAEKVPLFAPFTGAESLRNPVDRYIFHYRASYNQEVEVFIQGPSIRSATARSRCSTRTMPTARRCSRPPKRPCGSGASCRRLRECTRGTFEDVYQALEKLRPRNPMPWSWRAPTAPARNSSRAGSGSTSSAEEKGHGPRVHERLPCGAREVGGAPRQVRRRRRDHPRWSLPSARAETTIPR